MTVPRLSMTEGERQMRCVIERIDAYRADRERAGWDCYRIAESLGLSYMTLQNRIKRPEGFKLVELQRVANVLNITVATLIGDRQALEYERRAATDRGMMPSYYGG